MVKNISAHQAADWLATGEAILIDVREPDEFKAEHIAYAVSLPLSSVCEFFSQLNIPKTTKVIFQCFKGSRGQQACMLVDKDEIGPNENYNIEGGITAWKDAGFPVVSNASEGLSIFRQVQLIVGCLVASFVILGFLGLTLGFVIAGALGGALFFAGLTGWCGLAMLLSKMPWNKRGS